MATITFYIFPSSLLLAWVKHPNVGLLALHSSTRAVFSPQSVHFMESKVPRNAV